MAKQLGKAIKKKRNKEDLNYDWKSRHSELSGYGKAYYINTEEGNYLRADIGNEKGTIRLYVELESEGGAGYASVIKDGEIIAEKSSSSQRSGDFSEKFEANAEVFSTLPNSSFLKLIAGNYGIISKNSVTERLEETRKKYFKDKKADKSKKEIIDASPRFWNRFKFKIKFADFIDFFVGALIIYIAFWLSDYNLEVLGAVSAIFGILIGSIDIFIRIKDPMFSKMFIFILIGIFLYAYGYIGRIYF